MAERQHVLLGLAGVVPGHLHLEPPGRGVQLQRLDDVVGHPLERVQLRSGQEPLADVVPLEDAPHGRRVGLAPEVAEPRQHPPRLIHPYHVGEVFAELGEGVDVVQHQPPAVQAQQPSREVH